MYLFNRVEAGRRLAAELVHYRYENTAIMCLSPGGVLVGQEIARYLHSVITMLLVRDIILPGTNPPSVGMVDQNGGFTYNNMFSAGELEAFYMEFYQYIEWEKLHQLHEMNEALGQGGLLERSFYKGHNVIIVSDGLSNGTSVEAAVEYLKPVATEKVIAAVPFVSVEAVDRLHVLTDEVHVLDVKANYLDTDHYYEDNYIPSKEEIQAIINQIVLQWS